jgi:hypothetical protein
VGTPSVLQRQSSQFLIDLSDNIFSFVSNEPLLADEPVEHPSAGLPAKHSLGSDSNLPKI